MDILSTLILVSWWSESSKFLLIIMLMRILFIMNILKNISAIYVDNQFRSI